MDRYPWNMEPQRITTHIKRPEKLNFDSSGNLAVPLVLSPLMVGIAFVLLMALGGCSRDGSGIPNGTSGDYYFKFQVDGVQHSYPFAPETQINLTGILDHGRDSGLYAMNVAGIRDIGETVPRNRVIIFIGEYGQIKAGAPYSNFPVQQGEGPHSIFQLSYFDGQGNIHTAANNTHATSLYDKATVSFSEIAPDHISGTFSGTLKWYDASGGSVVLMGSVEIGRGSFKVPRH